MENSILLAKFIGPYITLVGIALLFNLKTCRRIMEDFFKNSALVYVTGLITFVAGMAIVLFHNIWVLDWRVIITLFGWNTLIKGGMAYHFPRQFIQDYRGIRKEYKISINPLGRNACFGNFPDSQGLLDKISRFPIFLLRISSPSGRIIRNRREAAFK